MNQGAPWTPGGLPPRSLALATPSSAPCWRWVLRGPCRAILAPLVIAPAAGPCLDQPTNGWGVCVGHPPAVHLPDKIRQGGTASSTPSLPNRRPASRWIPPPCKLQWCHGQSQSTTDVCNYSPASARHPERRAGVVNPGLGFSTPACQRRQPTGRSLSG